MISTSTSIAHTLDVLAQAPAPMATKLRVVARSIEVTEMNEAPAGCRSLAA